MSEDSKQPSDPAPLHRIVLLLERLVVAVEKIADVQEEPVGKVWLSDVERQCKPSAKRWFELVYGAYPEIRYAEQITEHHLNQWRTIRADTRQHIREKIREMISQ